MPAGRRRRLFGHLRDTMTVQLGGRSSWARPSLLVVGALGAVLLLVMPRLVEGAYTIRVLAAAGLAVILTASLNVVAGYTGLLSLGHIGFYAIGAYLYAFLASPHFGLHLPFPVGRLAAATLAAAVGLLIGWPSLRLRGDYLAMVTLAFAEIVRNLALSLDRPINLTGGVNGILGLDIPRLAGLELRGLTAFYYLIWAFAFLTLALIGRPKRSRIRRAGLPFAQDGVAAA